MTLEELIAHQAEIDAGHVHLVDVGPLSFRLAHTDAERACGENTEACPAHRWLSEFNRPPVEPGVYVAVDYEPDAYSESYPLPPYELIPLAAFSTTNPPGEVCPDCDGDGEVAITAPCDEPGEGPCPTCGGSGRVAASSREQRP
jgi:hypothetical protein